MGNISCLAACASTHVQAQLSMPHQEASVFFYVIGHMQRCLQAAFNDVCVRVCVCF